MPSAITLPTFAEREKLLYQKLNAAMQAINAKFAAGVGAAELAWPLTAGGNLDLSIYNIVNGRQIWGFVNADEYDDLDDAIAAAGSGGVVLVPPETTIVANGASISGTGATIIGSGPSSVLKLTEGASAGYLLRFNSVTRGLLANLTIDGNLATGVSQEGIRVSDCAGMVVSGVYFRNCSGAALKIQGDTSQVSVLGCQFSGGDEEHIYVTQCDQLAIVGCHSASAGEIPIRLACASGAATLTAAISDVTIKAAGSSGVSFVGYNSIGSTSPARLWMSNVSMNAGGTTKDGIVAGTATAVLESVSIVGCTVETPTKGGILVNANYGCISGNSIINPTTFGIDLDTSRYLAISDNYVYSAATGIDASGGQSCSIHGNILRSSFPPILYGGTDHAINNNPGAGSGAPTGGSMVFSGTVQQYSGAVDNSTVALFSLPAKVLRQGSVLTLRLNLDSGNDGSEGQTHLMIGDDHLCNVSIGDANINGCWMFVDAYVSSFTDGELVGNGFGVKEGDSVDSSTFTLTGLDFSSTLDFRVECDAGTTKLYSVFVKFDHATVGTYS